MPLIKQGRLAEDRWRQIEDGEPIAPGEPAIVSLERWQSEREALAGRNAPLGLRLRSEQSPEAVAAELGRFTVIALEFPRFQDGRAYSSARILRERYGYAGEIRAVGQVLRDQFLFLLRCGFDAFEVADAADAAAWQEALDEIAVFYQATGDRRPTAWSLRKQLRAAKRRRATPRKVATSGAAETGPVAVEAAGTAGCWAY